MKNLLGGFPNEEYPPELFKARRVEYLFNMKRTVRRRKPGCFIWFILLCILLGIVYALFHWNEMVAFLFVNYLLAY